ncbi:nitroreductase family deazaflavin-dependent oxidoreductase [Streptomyces sp. NBC_00670]|uniref:nitroreductase family deazaflavin-dependent oxidoreductase n=1 Tax=Streptomyces sp. NBC_00670 TaxID=2975804 RepID=UPI002E315317|nr:nitroreductase family deazaflavin-dependent oxidoreductase [Streptomyces sp. NBC_00670]
MLLFRIGLGPLLSRRFVLLHHVGHETGYDRRAVVEVVAYEPSRRSWVVAAGLSTDAEWYRDLRAQPKTVLQFGNRHHAVTARFLTPDEGAEITARHVGRHPRSTRRLCAFRGLSCDSSESSLREAGRAIPFVRLDGDMHQPVATHRP